MGNARQVLIAIAGPNGAGKSTLYETEISYTGLPFVNADILAAEGSLGAYEAAEVAEAIRRERFKRRESFIFETDFSDPVGDELASLAEAAKSGYTVVLLFVGEKRRSFASAKRYPTLRGETARGWGTLWSGG